MLYTFDSGSTSLNSKVKAGVVHGMLRFRGGELSLSDVAVSLWALAACGVTERKVYDDMLQTFKKLEPSKLAHSL
jgi:hypothetical protein